MHPPLHFLLTLTTVQTNHTITPKTKKSTIEEKRAINKNAYKKWDEESDKLLCKLYEEGNSISNLAKKFERTRGAISRRLEKLGLLKS